MVLISVLVAFLGCLVQGTDTDTEIDSFKCFTQPDESLICEFHVHPTDKMMDHKVQDDHELKVDCPKDSNVCVQVSISTWRQGAKPVEQNEIEPPTKILTTTSSDGSISVGKATYRPPFSQYGDRVAQHLNHQLPSSSTKIEWASWYLTLGMEHGSMNSQAAVVDWVEMELALNAYRQASEQIGTPVSSEEELFLASVYFQMGETYLFHREEIYGKDALEYFEKAKELYYKLRNAPASEVMDPEDVELRWADACTRISLLLVSSATPIQHYALDIMADAMNDGGENNDMAEMNLEYYEKGQEVETLLQDAAALLEGAMAVYKAALQKQDNTWERITTQMSLSTALQNAAIVASMKNRLDQAKEYNLEALSLHRDDLLPNLHATSPEGENSKITTADILLGLADTTLQMGQYDEANLYYRQALEWHEQQDIVVAPIQLQNDDEHGDTLQLHVDALRDYRKMVEGGNVKKEVKPEGLLDDGPDFYYERDNEYEGDLHFTLGTLYLSNDDDLDKTVAYFENAISLYQINDSNSRRMADAKKNLAMALFRERQFQESIRLHTEALELYRELYGDGVNPLSQGFEDYEELFLSQGVKGAEGGTDGGASATPETGVVGGIHIDLGKYKQSLKNATEAANQSPKVTDEL